MNGDTTNTERTTIEQEISIDRKRASFSRRDECIGRLGKPFDRVTEPFWYPYKVVVSSISLPFLSVGLGFPKSIIISRIHPKRKTVHTSFVAYTRKTGGGSTRKDTLASRSLSLGGTRTGRLLLLLFVFWLCYCSIQVLMITSPFFLGINPLVYPFRRECDRRFPLFCRILDTITFLTLS